MALSPTILGWNDSPELPPGSDFGRLSAASGTGADVRRSGSRSGAILRSNQYAVSAWAVASSSEPQSSSSMRWNPGRCDSATIWLRGFAPAPADLGQRTLQHRPDLRKLLQLGLAPLLQHSDGRFLFHRRPSLKLPDSLLCVSESPLGLMSRPHNNFREEKR